MKRFYSLLALLMVLTVCHAIELPVKKNEWRNAVRQTLRERATVKSLKKEGIQRVSSKVTTKVGPASTYGTLYGPNDKEWYYTADFDTDGMHGYTGAHVKIYDENNQLKGSIDDTFDLAEHQTGVNVVQIDPNITQKFFNVNDKYEIIMFIHATTDDYTGYVYQRIYSLQPNQTEPLMTIPGSEIMIIDVANDQWSEKKQMVMLREEFTDDDQYFWHLDVYKHAGWGGSPELLHTFDVDYNYISGSGEFSLPIAAHKINGKVHYALPHYEKPFFDQSVPMWEEPVVTPDNNLLIDLYTEDDFTKPYKTVTIPIETEEDYYCSFPSLGSFFGNDDFSVGLFGSETEPYFIVTNDNYITSSDEFDCTVKLYDQDGKYVKTIVSGAHDILYMADIDGQEAQFCVMDDKSESLKFVNVPSCEQVAEIPFQIETRMLSTLLDRVPVGDSYNIVISGMNGEFDSEDNVLHPIAWFNSDGSIKRWDMINVGPDAVMAQPAIISKWLNPYLFNTDSDVEYMFLVKLPKDGNTSSSETEEHLWVVKANGEKILDLGPDAEMGAINSVAIMNAGTTKAALSVAYYDWSTDVYTLTQTTLPFERFSAGGSGTVSNPYLISTLGDLMLIQDKPNVYYKLVNDIDCAYYPFPGNICEFEGQLDGDNHVIRNLSINGSGLVSTLASKGTIMNLTLENPKLAPKGDFAGFVAGTTIYDGTNVPTITNVKVIAPEVDDEEYEGSFGTIVGELTTGSHVNACSVTGANINLPQAVAGGIVGSVNPTGAEVKAVSFNGQLYAGVAGGIVGDASAGSFKNIHVCADIVGSKTAGGVIGMVNTKSSEDEGSPRPTFENCYVEGTLVSVNEKAAAVGGIAGRVEKGGNQCIFKNVVALESIEFEAGVTEESAHRIVGHTSADEPGEILWEDSWWTTFPGDPYSHPELWPRAAATPETGLNNNYAVSPVEPINGDAAMAQNDSSLEGKTVNESDYDNWQDFFLTTGFLFGDDIDAPWAWSNGKPLLWFETTTASTINNTTANGKKPATNNRIYNLGGQQVSKDYKGIVIINGKKIVK